MNIISREQARYEGKKYYYSGIPCKHGHIDQRMVINGRCVVCMAEYERKHRRKMGSQKEEDARGFPCLDEQKTFAELMGDKVFEDAEQFTRPKSHPTDLILNR